MLSSTPSIAVIVATKDRSKLLAERSLPSIINQTLTPDFLIISDDSLPLADGSLPLADGSLLSPDGSNISAIETNRAIVQQLQIPNCHISHIVNNRTRGASGCWNSAIDFLVAKVSSPEQVFVAFLDDDDQWHPMYLEQCINTIKANNLDMVASGINRIEGQQVTPYENSAPETLTSFSFLTGNPGIQGSNLFLRLSTFLQAGCFDESLSSSTDRDICIRLADISVIKYQALPLYLVDHYAESNRSRLSTSGSSAKLSGLTTFWQKYHGRMTEQQKAAFVQRALALFNWQAPKLTELKSQQSNEQIIKQQTLNQQINEQRMISAQQIINRNYKVSNLKLLGSGSEAIVFTDKTTVYKCIDYWKTRTPDAQFEFLRTKGPTWKNTPGLYPLQSVIKEGSYTLITYPFEKSTPYKGGCIQQFIQLINGCTHAGIVCNNIHPKNLIVTETELKLIDYGSDIRPWNELGFIHMTRRAYLSCRYPDHPQLKNLMRQSLTESTMPELHGIEQFQAQLDYPINKPALTNTNIPIAPAHLPFELVIGVISSDPIMIMPLLNSLRVLTKHPSISKLSIVVLCNGCDSSKFITSFKNTDILQLNIELYSQQQQQDDTRKGLFGANISHKPKGQVGIAFARTMLQRYVGIKLTNSPNSIGWILDDDMRIDKRAFNYITWLPTFRQHGVDVVFGAYEGSSPNPPLNGLRVQLMDLVHNLSWLAQLPECSIIPDRSDENNNLRNKFSDYYYDLSRKHTAHLESPMWLEPSYPYETVKEAKVRLIAGAFGILNGTPLTRSIIATECKTPLADSKDSVNRGGCTFILNHDALHRTPNLIPNLNQKEARRSDMIWAIINRYYRGMTLKAVPFPIYHVGRSSTHPTINAEKVQAEIIGSALYAGLTDFLTANPNHKLNFTAEEKQQVYQESKKAMSIRMLSLHQSFYRIIGLTNVLANGPFACQLQPLITCLNEEFSTSDYKKIQSNIKNLNQQDIESFLAQITKSADAYSDAFDRFKENSE